MSRITNFLRVVAYFSFVIVFGFVQVNCKNYGGSLSSFMGDIKPPGVLDAKPSDSKTFTISFDEPVRTIDGSYASKPADVRLDVVARLSDLIIGFDPSMKPGLEYGVSGEVEDGAGNITRFLFTFIGWNDHPAHMKLLEIQTGKNSSISSPHRDYVEFLATGAGNLGGMELLWASSVKQYSYYFPCVDVAEGDIVVLHLAPEGIDAEKDETGSDTTISGGVDSSPEGRDIWSFSGPLPDETGVIILRGRKGEEPMDGILYATPDKSGPIEAEKMLVLVTTLSDAKIWTCSAPPRWEDAFQWKSSSAKPLHMVSSDSAGKGRWVVGEAGSQSPGLREPGKTKTKAANQKGKTNQGARVTQ
jgi:hypothetical protein